MTDYPSNLTLNELVALAENESNHLALAIYEKSKSAKISDYKEKSVDVLKQRPYRNYEDEDLIEMFDKVRYDISSKNASGGLINNVVDQEKKRRLEFEIKFRNLKIDKPDSEFLL